MLKNKRFFLKNMMAACILSFSLLFLLSNCQSFDEPGVKPSKTKPAPSGNIYFRLAGVDSIYFLDTETREFKRLALPLNHLWDFDVSGDGNWLLIAHGNKIERMNLLKFTFDYSRTPSILPNGQISCNRDGRVVIYETQYELKKRVAILYVESGDNFVLKSDGDFAAYNPLLNPAGQAYAWTQNSGLYYAKLNQSSFIKLYDRAILPESFSPSGNYLTSDGHIFDLFTLSIYPGNHGGKLKFIDDYNLIQQKPADADSLQRINISGTERVFLFRTHIPIVDFVISDSQRFVASVSADDSELLFTVFDFVDLEKEFEAAFPIRQKKLSKLIWPLKPSSSTQND